MTNVDKVKAYVYEMPNRFTSKQLHAHMTDPELTVEQVGKALKSVKTVKALGKGQFSIRGRLVK